MTLQSTSPIEEFTEDGITLVHSINFQFNDASEIVCTRIPVNDVESAPLTQGSAYTVSGGGGGTGSVTKTSGGVAGTVFRIRRVTQEMQATKFTASSSFPAANVEKAFDRQMAVAQEVDTNRALLEERTIRAPAGESIDLLPAKATRANKFMMFSSLGSIALLSAADVAQQVVQFIGSLLGTINKGDPGSPGEGYSTLAAAATAANTATALDDFYVTEKNKTGKWIFHTVDSFLLATGASLTACVAADTTNGIFKARANDATGASGALVRQFDGEVWWHWWGTVSGDAGGANATTNNAAITAMQAVLNALPFNAISTLKGSYPIRIAPGFFEHSIEFGLNFGDVVLRGSGSGHGIGNVPAGATVLKPIGCHGIANRTSRAFISDFCIEGDFTTTEAEFHGVYSQGLLFADRILVRNMRGDGFHLTSLDGGSVDCSKVQNCEAYFCRDGMSTSGSDGNVVQVIGGIYNQNRRWGVAEPAGGLGNIYAGVETAANGINSVNDGVTIAATAVSFAGNIYFVKADQDVGASTNPPSGTAADNTWWICRGAGGVTTGVPAWFNGILTRAGGGFFASSQVAASAYYGCYSEVGQGFAQLKARCAVMGGHLASYGQVYMGDSRANYVPGLINAASDGTVALQNSLQVANVRNGAFWKYSISDAANPAVLLEVSDPTYLTDHLGTQLMVDTDTGDVIFTSARNTAVNIGWRYTGPNSTATFADGLAHPHVLYIPTLYLPTTGGGRATGKQVTRAAAPTVIYAKSYVAPLGGATIDDVARASLGELAADVDKIAADLLSLRDQLKAANLTE